MTARATPNELVLIPYPAIGMHGVTGDRRTAVLVSSDGTIDWMCLPDYGGCPVFGVLLDARRGGYFRLGPELPVSGAQSYRDETSEVVTRWTMDTGEIELGDLMPWPDDQRPHGPNELGNYPLLFSHAAYIRAVVALDEAYRHVGPGSTPGGP